MDFSKNSLRMRLHNIRPFIVPITEFIDIPVVAEISDLSAGCPGETPFLGRHPLYPLARHPPGQTPLPVQCMLGYGQQAGGTNPTGMHSCLTKILMDKLVFLLWQKLVIFLQGALGRHPSWVDTPYTPWPDTPLARHPSLCSACWDTVNKRAVQILLECIHV